MFWKSGDSESCDLNFRLCKWPGARAHVTDATLTLLGPDEYCALWIRWTSIPISSRQTIDNRTGFFDLLSLPDHRETPTQCLPNKDTAVSAPFTITVYGRGDAFEGRLRDRPRASAITNQTSNIEHLMLTCLLSSSLCQVSYSLRSSHLPTNTPRFDFEIVRRDGFRNRTL